jgi:hypothetical protein
LSANDGQMEWNSCYGEKYDNYFNAMDVHNNIIYIAYTTYNQDHDQFFLVMATIDLDTGKRLASKLFQTKSDDKIYNIVANSVGVFVLATINHGFRDIENNTVYHTQYQNKDLAILFMDHK